VRNKGRTGMVNAMTEPELWNLKKRRGGSGGNLKVNERNGGSSLRDGAEARGSPD